MPRVKLLIMAPLFSFFLAANPSIQDWLSEELYRVLGDKPHQEWDYYTDLPRLKRCLAVLYETLRVKTPVAEVKWTNKLAQCLDFRGRMLTIPPTTLIIPSYIYVHKHPQFWGPDAHEWRPERWIEKQNNDNHRKSAGAASPQKQVEHKYRLDGQEEDAHEDEVLLQPPSRGNYLGWSEGTRDCPAKRFSQVEWVAILAALFRDWKVKPLQLDHETPAEARMRVLGFIEKNTDYGGLLLQLMHPERLPLVWSSRYEK